MKKSTKLNALVLAIMMSSSAVIAQELKSSNDAKMEGKVKVHIVNDENGKVEEYTKEFNLEDQEELDKFLEEKGVELQLQELHKHATKDGKPMKVKVIKEIEDKGDGEEEKVMIMRVNAVSEDDMDFEQNFEFNWVGDSTDGEHKIMKFKFPSDGEEGENVFIFDMENLDGADVKRTQSFIFIKRNQGDEEDDFGTGITEAKLDDMPIENLKMFPNPNDGNFSTEFTVTEPSNVLINITDSKGANIYEKELNNFSGKYTDAVDLSKEESGLYFYNLKIGDKVQSNKIILQ